MTTTLSLLAVILSTGAHLQPPREAAPRLDTRPAGLPSRIVHDLARLGRARPLIVLGAGGAAAAALHPADGRIGRALSSSAPAEATLDGGSTLGGSAVQFGVAGAVYGAGLATHREGAAAVGSALLEAQVVEGILAQGLKYAVNRSRPDGGRYSFPSGHTSSAFATADVLLQRFGWKVGLAAYAGAAYVGASRISERQHYLSDVLFGAAIGVASARALPRAARAQVVRVSPVMLHHGAEVLVSVGHGR
jgi:membrane-associated phospholipid phosphatase